MSKYSIKYVPDHCGICIGTEPGGERIRLKDIHLLLNSLRKSGTWKSKYNIGGTCQAFEVNGIYVYLGFDSGFMEIEELNGYVGSHVLNDVDKDIIISKYLDRYE